MSDRPDGVAEERAAIAAECRLRAEGIRETLKISPWGHGEGAVLALLALADWIEARE